MRSYFKIKWIVVLKVYKLIVLQFKSHSKIPTRKTKKYLKIQFEKQRPIQNKIQLKRKPYHNNK